MARPLASIAHHSASQPHQLLQFGGKSTQDEFVEPRRPVKPYKLVGELLRIDAHRRTESREGGRDCSRSPPEHDALGKLFPRSRLVLWTPAATSPAAKKPGTRVA